MSASEPTALAGAGSSSRSIVEGSGSSSLSVHGDCPAADARAPASTARELLEPPSTGCGGRSPAGVIREDEEAFSRPSEREAGRAEAGASLACVGCTSREQSLEQRHEEATMPMEEEGPTRAHEGGGSGPLSEDQCNLRLGHCWDVDVASLPGGVSKRRRRGSSEGPRSDSEGLGQCPADLLRQISTQIWRKRETSPHPLLSRLWHSLSLETKTSLALTWPVDVEASRGAASLANLTTLHVKMAVPAPELLELLSSLAKVTELTLEAAPHDEPQSFLAPGQLVFGSGPDTGLKRLRRLAVGGQRRHLVFERAPEEQPAELVAGENAGQQGAGGAAPEASSAAEAKPEASGHLPFSLSSLSSLESFEVVCRRVYGLPAAPGQLQHLLLYVERLKVLPAWVAGLKGSLRSLCIASIERLELPQGVWDMLPGLQRLYLKCNALVEGNLSSWRHMPCAFENLRDLRVSCNVAHMLFPFFPRLCVLTSFHIRSAHPESARAPGVYGACAVELPATVASFTKLTSLSLHNCLQNIPQSLLDLPLLKPKFRKELERQVMELRGVQDVMYTQRRAPDDLSSLPGLSALRFYQYAFHQLPPTLHLLRELKVLAIENCRDLQDLPPSIGGLVALEQMRLRSCPGITSLPNEMGRLRSLQRLSIRDCASLMALPASFCALTALVHVALISLPSLVALPDSLLLGELGALEELIVGECPRLAAIPRMFHRGWSPTLRRLHIRGATISVSLSARGFTVLPSSLQCLRGLRSLTVANSCEESLADDWACLGGEGGNGGALEELILQECHYLEALPPSLGAVTTLRRLELRKCPALQVFPQELSNLPALTALLVDECPRLPYDAIPQPLHGILQYG